MSNLILVCQCLGGSHSYGLNTPQSDTDHRGIFLNNTIGTIIGLDKHEHQQTQKDGVDDVYTEFRHALKLLRQANTQMVELLYNENWISLSTEWQNVINHRKELVDSERLFSCLRGYMQGELRLANGERTGKLGGKRKEAIDKYGFSPKNFVQLFRLAWAGQYYFYEGVFPVKVADFNQPFADFLLSVKTQPEKHNKEDLNSLALTYEADLVKAYENRKVTTKFNEEIANELCLSTYWSIVTSIMQAKVDKDIAASEAKDVENSFKDTWYRD